MKFAFDFLTKKESIFESLRVIISDKVGPDQKSSIPFEHQFPIVIVYTKVQSHPFDNRRENRGFVPFWPEIYIKILSNIGYITKISVACSAMLDHVEWITFTQ